LNIWTDIGIIIRGNDHFIFENDVNMVIVSIPESICTEKQYFY